MLRTGHTLVDEAAKHNVLPLDDRFRERFVVNAHRLHGVRKRYVLHGGMGHLPTEVAPDVRNRSYLTEADVDVGNDDEGVLIAHGDAASGYSLYLQDRRLVHDMNIGGEHVIVRSRAFVAPGKRRLGVRVRRPAETVLFASEFTLLIDGIPAGRIQSQLGFCITATVEDGIREIISALHHGVITDPQNPAYRN